MINEENDHSCGLGASRLTETESDIERAKPQTVDLRNTDAIGPVVSKTCETVESIKQFAEGNRLPSLPALHASQTYEVVSPIAANEEIAEISPQKSALPTPQSIGKSEAIESIELPADAEGPPLSTDRESPIAEAVSSAMVTFVCAAKPQGFLSERPPLILEAAPRVLRYRTRRDLLLFGAGAVAVAAGAGVLVPQATLGRLGVKRNINPRGKEWLLNNALRIDDDVAEALYSQNRMVPTYAKSRITPISYDIQFSLLN